MPRISGVDLPRNKRIEIGLMYIYGIGRSTSRLILDEAGVDPRVRTSELSDEQVTSIRNVIERSIKVEGDLRTSVAMNIRRLIDIGSYRGTRHRRGLPVRGQRTRTNARTRKGKAKTVGLGKRKVVKSK